MHLFCVIQFSMFDDVYTKNTFLFDIIAVCRILYSKRGN